MSGVDKNQVVTEYLFDCPQIYSSKLFFNYINAKDDTIQMITSANDKIIHAQYIDGSVLKRYTLNLIVFKSISYNPVVKMAGYPDENMDDMLDVQGIIDWVEEQNENRNFPDFGEDCIVESIETLTDNPELDGVNDDISPGLVQYSISIRIEYLDKSKVIWKRGA